MLEARLIPSEEPNSPTRVEPEPTPQVPEPDPIAVATSEAEYNTVQRLAVQVDPGSDPSVYRAQLAATFRVLGDKESVEDYREWFKAFQTDDEAFFRAVDEIADAKKQKF